MIIIILIEIIIIIIIIIIQIIIIILIIIKVVIIIIILLLLLMLIVILRIALCKICNVSLFDDQWLQISLPVKSGGVRLRRVASLAPSVFIASAVGTRNLQNQILQSFV